MALRASPIFKYASASFARVSPDRGSFFKTLRNSMIASGVFLLGGVGGAAGEILLLRETPSQEDDGQDGRDNHSNQPANHLQRTAARVERRRRRRQGNSADPDHGRLWQGPARTLRSHNSASPARQDTYDSSRRKMLAEQRKDRPNEIRADLIRLFFRGAVGTGHRNDDPNQRRVGSD